MTYMYKTFIKEPYSFLYLKLHTTPAEIYLNFQQKLNWKKYRKIAREYKSLKDLESDDEENMEDGEKLY